MYPHNVRTIILGVVLGLITLHTSKQDYYHHTSSIKRHRLDFSITTGAFPNFRPSSNSYSFSYPQPPTTPGTAISSKTTKSFALYWILWENLQVGVFGDQENS